MRRRRHTPDSTPTPATGLSLSQLGARCRERADRLERAGAGTEGYRVASELTVLALQLQGLPEDPPGSEEGRRNGLLTRMQELFALADTLERGMPVHET